MNQAADRLRAALAALQARGIGRGHRVKGGGVAALPGGGAGPVDAQALVAVTAADLAEAALAAGDSALGRILAEAVRGGNPARTVYLQADDLYALLEGKGGGS